MNIYFQIVYHMYTKYYKDIYKYKAQYILIKEEDFRLLRSHLYYKFFHSYENVGTSNSICEQLTSVLSSNQDFNSFCCKLSKNVVLVGEVLIDPTKNKELCTYLNYWLYDALIKKNFLDKTDKIYESKVIKELSGLWNSFYNNNKCKLEQYDMNVTDFNNMKVLSDYSQNYYGITEHLKDPDTQKCKKLYCSYINKIKDTYNDFTPGGNLIRKLIRKKSGSTFNSDDINSGNWLPLSPESQNDVLQNKRFEILYQAMKKN
ncbi:hypothetical protein PVMG_04853 [Plasmodium vivax Mauritania I]|uniref:PIR Superfamily Protein n=1 Tax=Plasmodium vivax Mauritania I TaxID=1035515 RepID=A0A0J9T7W8_PLAVI|nr:hypothetical protein PVMG_04853 [Plasmodium vivax Mauritania I]